MRVLVGAALVVGTMADGHCANTDCDACEAAFTECGGFTNSAGLMAAYTEWAAIAEPTAANTNCINKADNLAWAARNDVEAACTASGGSAWATYVPLVAESCEGTADTADWTTGETDCTDRAQAAATCTGSGGAGPSTASAELCQVLQTNDDAVSSAFTGAGTGECTGTTTASGVAAALCTTACTALGNGAGTAPDTDNVDCELDAADNTWVEDGTCETTTNPGAVTANAVGGVTQALCDAEISAATTWTPTFAGITTAVWGAGNAASGGCTGGADGDAGDFGTGCDVTKAQGCITHYDTPANADCWAAADPSDVDPSSADGSDVSPASMLQVGAAVLASLAMLL